MPVAGQTHAQRRRLEVSGVVQGVGFRPFVHRLARRHGMGGFVRNEGGSVLIEVEGDAGALDAFQRELTNGDGPALAHIDAVLETPLAPLGEAGFEILPSDVRRGAALIPPDVATCDECLRELFDAADRRFRYPFINCTQCGPRLTIVRSAPYDRANTTMASFGMCEECRREYEDPEDRRFHAEPIACPACGPRLSMALHEAVAGLRGGAVLAVKGIGGYHLACDARDEQAVAALRRRKLREHKPFAVMTDEPNALALVGAREDELLRSPQRPIVLVKRRRDGVELASAVAPGSPWLGLMLPYTPLHHLLLHDFGGPLVMTSGNRSDEPIAFDDAEARARLSGIADAFLTHNRPIHRRCEDSVVRERVVLRRSRGYAPSALRLPLRARRPLLAVGAELKSTFCVARDNDAFLSAHLGDLSSADAYRCFRSDLGLWLDMLDLEPAFVAHDMHPNYLATRWAQEQGLPLIEVQHHHAHAAACLAEHGERGPALALVFDGTGFGPDGTLWGGELLHFDLEGFERLGHLEPVPLPGGEAAVREPWRMAAAYLERAGCAVPFERWPLVRQSLGVNAPLSSGMGRLFDAVAAMLGLRERVSYEGQAAVELELLAGDTLAAPYPCRVDDGVMHGTDLIAVAHEDFVAGRPTTEIAAAFHEGVSDAAVRLCVAAGTPRTVVLSGGTFQNLRLLASVGRGLRAAGFRALAHRAVPPNDGGISYGQAAVAAGRISSCA